MRIQLNGEPRDVSPPLTISGLLAQLGIDSRTVAIEHNLIVVKRGRYAETTLAEGDEVEIVRFVGGG
jgi:thiamine biosynthesis protein ThiS